MRKGIFIWAALVSILFFNAGFAQEQQRALSLDECVSMALSYYPSITAARESIASARADKAGSASRFLPTVSLGYNHVWMDEAPSMNVQGMNISTGKDQIETYSFSATQPITSLFTVLEDYKMKDIGVDIAKIKDEMAKQDLVLQVKQAYFGLLKANRLRQVASETVNLVQTHVDNSIKFYDAGLIAKNDLLIAEVKLADAKQQLVVAEHALALAQAGLNSLIGLDLNTPVTVVDVEEKRGKIELTEQDLQTLASDNRLEIKEIDQQVKMAQAARGLALSQIFPEAMISASVSHTEGSTGDPDEKSIMLGLSWSFGDWGKRYFAHRAALHTYKGALAGRELVKKQVELDVRQSYLAVLEATKSIDVSEKAIEQAEENLRIIQKKYEVQAATSTDVLDAQTALTQAKLNYYSALYDLQLAIAKLERAVGTDVKQVKSNEGGAQ